MRRRSAASVPRRRTRREVSDDRTSGAMMAGAAGADGADGLLPAICRHFNAPTGCRRPNCQALHVCFYFVTGKCRFGDRCRLPHSLETGRSVALLRQLGCSTSRYQLAQLLAELRRQHSSGGGSKSSGGGGEPVSDGPRVCLHYNGSGCLATDCASLHLCYLFVTGRCPPGQCRRHPTPLSHSLTSVHNSHVLRLCSLINTAEHEVLRRLRQEAAERPLRPTVCRRYNSRDGCPAGGCRQLHCCFHFTRGDCAYGERCRFDHLLNGSHNLRVLRFYDLDAVGALLAFKQDLRDVGTAPRVDVGTAPRVDGGGPAPSTRALSVAVADAVVSRSALAQLRQQRDAETTALLDEHDKLERTLRTVGELNSEAERELASSRQASRALQVEAEHASLVAQERELQLAERQGRLLTERDSLELSLLTTAESSEQLESVVSGLNAKLSVLEIDYQRSQGEQQRLAAALEQERRLQREQQQRLAADLEQERRLQREQLQQREEELERTLVCSVCLEMFVTATTLGCSHTFCRECVSSVQRHVGDALCPMCRAPIRSKTPSITLDQMVERAVQTMSQEKRIARRVLLRERGLPEAAI